MDTAPCLDSAPAPSGLAVVSVAERFEVVEVVVERVSVFVVHLKLGLAVGDAASDAAVSVAALGCCSRLLVFGGASHSAAWPAVAFSFAGGQRTPM